MPQQLRMFIPLLILLLLPQVLIAKPLSQALPLTLGRVIPKRLPVYDPNTNETIPENPDIKFFIPPSPGTYVEYDKNGEIINKSSIPSFSDPRSLELIPSSFNCLFCTALIDEIKAKIAEDRENFTKQITDECNLQKSIGMANKCTMINKINIDSLERESVEDICITVKMCNNTDQIAEDRQLGEKLKQEVIEKDKIRDKLIPELEEKRKVAEALMYKERIEAKKRVPDSKAGQFFIFNTDSFAKTPQEIWDEEKEKEEKAKKELEKGKGEDEEDDEETAAHKTITNQTQAEPEKESKPPAEFGRDDNGEHVEKATNTTDVIVEGSGEDHDQFVLKTETSPEYGSGQEATTEAVEATTQTTVEDRSEAPHETASESLEATPTVAEAPSHDEQIESSTEPEAVTEPTQGKATIASQEATPETPHESSTTNESVEGSGEGSGEVEDIGETAPPLIKAPITCHKPKKPTPGAQVSSAKQEEASKEGPAKMTRPVIRSYNQVVEMDMQVDDI